MNPRHFNPREGFYDTALTSGASVYVPLGDGHGQVMDARQFRYLQFGFQSELDAVVTLEGAVDAAFTVTSTMWTIAVAPGIFSTVYDLAPALNNSGRYVLSQPFIQLNLADAATANHSYTVCYVKIW